MKLVLPIRVVIAAAVLLPVLAVSAALISLVAYTSRKVENNLGDSLVRDTALAMRQEVYFHLRDTVRVSELYAARLQQGTLTADDLSAWEKPMYDSLLVRPNVASVCFATPDGRAAFVLRDHGALVAGRAPGRGLTSEHAINAAGEVDPQALRSYDYNPVRRPWYVDAVKADKAIWTRPYFWYSDNPTASAPVSSLGFARAMRRPDGTIDGCLVVDVTLESISDMLRRTPLSDRGSVFVLDDENRVLAASGPDGLPRDRLVKLNEIGNAEMAAAAGALADSTLSDASTARTIEVTLNGEPSRLIVEPLMPFEGLNWRLVAIVKESSYLSQTRQLRQQAVIVAVVFSAFTLLIGLWLSRWISRPVVRLAAQVRRVAAGNLAEETAPNSTRELNSLAQAVNQMTRGLKEEIRLRAATEAAETANRAKTAFFTRVTHELRTPLNSIIGFTEMLEEDADDDHAKQGLGKILRASNQLLRLINDLLDLAKIESGKTALGVRDFAVSTVIEETMALVQPLARRGQNQLRVVSPPCRASMRSDPDKLRQILLNLLSNAAKYTEHGDITLAIACESEMIRFRVQDTGPGITVEEMPTLFEPFAQGRDSVKQLAGGTGLGLAICRQYAKLLGGDISVESEPGHGAKFTLFLPMTLGTTSESPEMGSVAGMFLDDHRQELLS